MPLVQIDIVASGPTTVQSPHTLPFSITVNQTYHAFYPVYLKSFAAKFINNVNLPKTIKIQFEHLHQDPEFDTIQFPIPSTLSQSFNTQPSYHFHTDMHLGDVSHHHTLKGAIHFHGTATVQLPSQFSMICFIDSEYM